MVWIALGLLWLFCWLLWGLPLQRYREQEYKQAVLDAISYLGNHATGRNIDRQVAAKTGQKRKHALVYVVLYELEEEGKVYTTWGEPDRSGGPRRLYYSVRG